MLHRFAKGVVALAACVPAVVLAQAQPAAPAGALAHREGSWELSVSGGATYLDQQLLNQILITSNARRLIPGAALRVGYNLGTMWNLSVGSFAGYGAPATVIQPFAAITWSPSVNWGASPFLTVGGGVTNVSWQGFKVTSKYGANVGAGIRFALGERLALRLEGREQYEKYQDATVFPKAVFNGTATAGLSFFLGAPRAPVAGVGVTPPVVTLEAVGATQQLAAAPTDNTGRPLSRRAVAWSSSDDAVATVSPTGLVMAVGNGSATITATSEGAAGTAAVTVAQAAATLAVAPATATLTAVGQTQQLAASAQDANSNAIASPAVTWTSSNAAAVSVTAAGLATAVRNGTATITATSAGHTATAQITVAQAVALVTVTPPTATINAAGGRAQFSVQATDASGRAVTGKVITWSSSAPAVATPGAGGVVTAVGNGTAQITATVEGQSGSATLTVAIPTRGGPAPAAPSGAAAQLPPPGTTMVLRDVVFRPNSARLPPDALAALDALAQAIQAVPNARWEIGGHTSSMGNAAQNQRLSRRRALAVRTYLIRQGVPAASLVAVGFGSAQPVVSNATAAGRRQNMRVEIKRLR